ncbi:MAG TPA: glycosyltransferase, partial [Steroidobacteraceae bacterium]|nr:glycosyltransferase [Steroidobacteraceae bacterium]
MKHNASGARIALATLGTLGDLNPFIGIAIALRDAGFAPVVVTHEQYRSLLEAAGIDFQPMRPDRGELQAASAMDAEQLFRSVRARPQTVLTRYVLPYLE